MSRSARIKVGAWKLFVEKNESMTNQISDACSQESLLSGSKESWVLCPAGLTRTYSLGLAEQISGGGGGWERLGEGEGGVRE